MNWLINASVWVQTPIVIVVLLAFAIVAAWLLNKALTIVMPRSAEEQRVLGPDTLRDVDEQMHSHKKSDSGSPREGLPKKEEVK